MSLLGTPCAAPRFLARIGCAREDPRQGHMVVVATVRGFGCPFGNKTTSKQHDWMWRGREMSGIMRPVATSPLQKLAPKGGFPTVSAVPSIQGSQSPPLKVVASPLTETGKATPGKSPPHHHPRSRPEQSPSRKVADEEASDWERRTKQKVTHRASDALLASLPAFLVDEAPPEEFLLLSRDVSRELCRRCGGFDVRGRPSLWIFCITCGESFHQDCAHDAPIPEHPVVDYLPPDCHASWHWQCRDCRKCSKCANQHTESIFTCFDCHDNYCSACDATEGLLSLRFEFGFYYLCAVCRSQRPRKCLNCHGDLPKSRTLRTLFCSVCSRQEACPRCGRRYPQVDCNIPMVACDNCGLWTHAVCAGLSKEQYLAMQDSTKQFFCFRCAATWDFDYDASVGLPKDCAICHDGVAESFLVPMGKRQSGSGCTTFAHPSCIAKRNKLPPSLPSPSPAPSPSVQSSTSGLWIRRGSMAVRLTQSTEEVGLLEIVKRLWNPKMPRQRISFTWVVPLDERRQCRGMSMVVGGLEGSLRRDAVSPEGALQQSRDLFDEEARLQLKLDHLAPEAFFTPEMFAFLRECCRTVEMGGTKMISHPRGETLPTPQPAPSIPARPASAKSTNRAEEECPVNGELMTCARVREHCKVAKKPSAMPHPRPSRDDDDRIRLIQQINSKRQPPNSFLAVRRSRIAGLGLFTTRLIPAHTRIIEYCGELIGQLVADQREVIYSRLPLYQHDCYLFRLAEDLIIDATLKANMARFINHSCEPNCESRIEGGRRQIAIYAIRDILEGEELAYDYKFSREVGEDPVPCFCGADKCRRYMNL